MFVSLSDPATADTDADGLADQAEYRFDTEPRVADTDADGLSDGDEIDADFNPTSGNEDGDSYGDAAELSRNSNPLIYDLSASQSRAAFLAGALAGEWRWGARRVGVSEAQISSPEYLAGQVLGSLAALGDVRDLVAQLNMGDYVGAATSASGVLPLGGDLVKASTMVKAFAMRGDTAARAARDYVHRQRWPRSVKVKVLSGLPAGAGAPWELRGGSRTTAVYVGRSVSGTVEYCGITKDLSVRQLAHGSRFKLEPIILGVSRGEARAIEQACIESLRKVDGRTAQNLINSISPAKSYYGDAVAFGHRKLDGTRLKELLAAG